MSKQNFYGAKQKPKVLRPEGADFVPESLRNERRWVLWKLVYRDGKWTKIPVRPNGKPAKSNDPETWSSFDAVRAVYKRNPAAFEGVGFVLGKGFVGIDLDNCRDPETGELAGWAKEIIDLMATYTEVSPSGTGVKLFCRGAWSGRGNRWKCEGGEIEVYDEGRYFTVTGRRVGETVTCADAQVALDQLAERCPPDAAKRRKADPAKQARPNAGAGGSTLSDDDIIRIAGKAKNGAKFLSLWNGDTSEYGGDHSAADLALVTILAFYTGRDQERLIELFRRSGLYRPKWDSVHSRDGRSYGRMTVQKALESAGNFYSGEGRASRGPALPTDQAGADNGDDAAPQEPDDDDEGTDPDRWPEKPDSPQRLACRLLDKGYTLSNGKKTLLFRSGKFYEWRDGCYRPVEKVEVEHRLQRFIAAEFRRVRRLRKGRRPVDVVTTSLVSNTMATLASLCSEGDPGTGLSSWLPGTSGPDPRRMVPMRNGLYDLATGELLPATPDFFCTSATEFNYDPTPPVPTRWLRFLHELWPDDPEAVECLREWMAYLLSGGTHLQKILVMLGPPRSGKSTVLRVLKLLIGESNFAALSPASFAGEFGWSALVDKSVGVFPDARFGGLRGEHTGIIVERLLSLSGEDMVLVNRKHMPLVSMRLGARIVISSNTVPQLAEDSGALARRFVVLRFTETFAGREDCALEAQLAAELPGIFAWVVSGWRTLAARGRFLQPASGLGLAEAVMESGSPVLSFIRDCCVLDPNCHVVADDLFAAWCRWCAINGQATKGQAVFGRELFAAVPKIEKIRPREGGGRRWAYRGVRLRVDNETPAQGDPSADQQSEGQAVQVVQANIYCSPSDDDGYSADSGGKDDEQKESTVGGILDRVGHLDETTDEPAAFGLSDADESLPVGVTLCNVSHSQSPTVVVGRSGQSQLSPAQIPSVADLETILRHSGRSWTEVAFFLENRGEYFTAGIGFRGLTTSQLLLVANWLTAG